MADPRVITPIRPPDPDNPGTVEQFHYLPATVPVPVPATSLDDYLRGLAELNAQLAERFRREKISFPIADSAQSNTDSSGNATFQITQAQQGWYYSINRLVVEAATFDASGAVTPAAASSAGWLGIFVADNPKAVNQGQMADFMPTTAGGQVIPAVGEYGNDERSGILVRSGEYLVIRLVSSVASKRITVNWQGVRWGYES